MSWLNFWAIPLGAAAAAVPLVIHLLTRPRPARLPLSTVRFVQEAVRQRRARHRLRDLVVLALRTAAVVLLATAVARPLVGERSLLSGDEATSAIRVVILDVSRSMAAEVGGIRAFERARPLAAKHLAYRPGLLTNLILAGASARPVFDRPSTNFAALRDEVGRADPRPERAGVQAALNEAARLLARQPGAEGVRRELVIVSDFQRANWAAADFTPLPGDTVIELESVAPAERPPNLAVLGVGTQGRVEVGREFRLEVDVGNYLPAARQLAVEVVVGDSTFRLQGLCPAGVTSTLACDATLESRGWQTGQARLVEVDDALDADNVRHLALEVRAPPTYLLVTRQPPGTRRASSYFLERALVPYRPRPDRSQEKVVRADPDRLERELVASADLLVLDHPGKLSAELVELVAALLRRGRGMLYVAAEPHDAVNLQRLAQAAGSHLQMPVEFAPPQAGQVRRNLFVADFRPNDVPFAVFGEDALAAIGPLRFSGGLTSRRIEGSLSDDVLATYGDQSALLVMTSSGAGLLAVLNAELASSNLPSSPVFVPLVGELVGHLLGRDRQAQSAACGEPAAVYLPGEAGAAEGLRVVAPAPADGETAAAGELVNENVGVLWELPAAGPPGVYQVKRGDQTVFALASGTPPEESDLATLVPNVLADRLAGGRAVHFRSAGQDEDPQDDLWTWLAVACVGCLLAELVALRVFRT